MRFYAALFIAFISLTLSCGKKQQQADPEKLLSRKWCFTENSTVDTLHYLFFSIDQYGTHNFELVEKNNDTVRGEWILENNIIAFTRTRNDAVSLSVDSLIINSTPGESSIDLYSQNNKVGVITNGELSEPSLGFSFAIDSISPSYLALSTGSKKIALMHVPKKIETSFSFLSLVRGLVGVLFLVIVGWLLSRNRAAINWQIVITGIVLQILFAIGVLKVPFIADIFESISAFFVKIISFTQEGTNFLFRSFTTQKIESPLVNFVIMVLPTVIFFSALTSLFFYWGILQRLVYGMAWVMKKAMPLSGAESMAAAGNIFLGQTEAPLLIKPYLANMTRSEILCLMTGGMATIAGGVLAAYIHFLGGDDPEQQLYFAKHLLAASVMSAPAAIVAAKLLVPETEEFNKEMKIPKEKIGANALEAIANGTGDGLRLAVNVAAMLLVFTALIAMGNWVMEDIIGHYTGVNGWIRENTSYSGMSMQFLLGYACAPVAYILGVDWKDAVLVGQLIGEKTILNEFYAYTTLGKMKMDNLFSNGKSIIIATYVLCGFANFASIGIQIGGIGSLAPNKKTTLAQLGFIALIGGTLACMFTAAIVGMLL
jgi:concentrative nucleoside transporter, CNT family